MADRRRRWLRSANALESVYMQRRRFGTSQAVAEPKDGRKVRGKVQGS